MQCDKEIEARRPDIAIDRVQNEVKRIDVAIPRDIRVPEKEFEQYREIQIFKE